MAGGFKAPKMPKEHIAAPKAPKISTSAETAALRGISAAIKHAQTGNNGRSRPMGAGAVPTFSKHPGHGNATKTAEQVAQALESKTKGMASQLAPF